MGSAVRMATASRTMVAPDAASPLKPGLVVAIEPWFISAPTASTDADG